MYGFILWRKHTSAIVFRYDIFGGNLRSETARTEQILKIETAGT